MTPANQKGFFGSLFDFSFTHYVTPKIIKIIFGLVIVVSALGALVVAIAAFAHNIVLGFFVLIIIAPLIFFVYVILYRVFLEVVMAVFTIAENTTALVGASNPSAPSAPAGGPPAGAPRFDPPPAGFEPPAWPAPPPAD
jgi:hypothetical protein